MISYKIFGGEKISLPSNVYELKTWQFEELLPLISGTKADQYDWVSILSVLSSQKLNGIADQGTIDRLSQYLVWIPLLSPSEKVPAHFEILGRKIAVPTKKDLTKMKIGQALYIASLISNGKPVMCSLSKVIAAIFQPLIDGEFDTDKVDALHKSIKDMPIEQTYGVGFFLLTQFGKNSRLFSNHKFKMIASRIKELGQRLIRWLIRPA